MEDIMASAHLIGFGGLSDEGFRVIPASADETKNAWDIFIEGFILFLAGALGMLLPLMAMTSNSSKGALFIAYGNAYAGGVMLAAGLVHMLADALRDYPSGPRMPLLLCFVGVMIPFALEKGGLLWFIMKHSVSRQLGDSKLISGHGILTVSDPQPGYNSTAHREEPIVRVASPPARLSSRHSHASSLGEHERNTCVMPAVVSAHLQVRLDFLREASNQALDIVDHAPTVVPKSANHTEMLTEDDEMFTDTHGEAVRETRHTHFSISWILLTIILVFHSVLAGFTLGVQSPSGTPALFVALLLHKVFESVAMGIASTQASNATKFMRQAQFLTYCLAAPVGVALGRAFSESSDAPSEATRALITALTSGSFIYISLVEITQEEFMDEKHRIQKFIAFMVGATMMLTLV